MATLCLKEMGKFLWEGREKSLPSWLSQFSFANPLKTYLAGFADNIEEWEFDAAWYEALFWPLDGATVDEVVDEAEEDEE